MRFVKPAKDGKFIHLQRNGKWVILIVQLIETAQAIRNGLQSCVRLVMNLNAISFPFQGENNTQPLKS